MTLDHRSSLPFCVLAALALPLAAPAEEIRLGSVFQVNAHTVESQRYPWVAADAGGDFVVAWQSYSQDGSKWDVFARRFTSAGAPLATEFQVNSFTGGHQYFPSVAADADGDFVVAWQGFGDGSSYGIFARRFASTGAALATEFQVNIYVTGDQRSPAVAAAAGGDFVVAWESREQDGAHYGIFARRFTSAGAALATEFQVNSHTSDSQSNGSVAMAAGGDFVVAWQSYAQDGESSGLFARRFTSAGAALASEFQVNTHTAAGQYFPSVGADADGGFVVAWQGDPGNGIFARRFTSAGGDPAPEFQVNTYTAAGQYFPSVAAGAGGDFVVAWQSRYQDGDSYGIFARRFTSAGAALATEFQVNSHTSDSQSNGSVAMDAGGDFVVAWKGEAQDGSGDGIFAQRFARPITLDVDGDGSFAALTDGLLVLRYAFGFRGATLVTGAVNLAGCTRCDAAAIESYLAGIS